METINKTFEDVLVIEDDNDIGTLIYEILLIKNIHTFIVHSLKQAKIILEKIIPFIIFLDNKLPDGFGIDFIDYLKNKCPDAHILMMTGFDKDKFKDLTKDQNAIDVLFKPFTNEDLLQKVNKYIVLLEVSVS
jgi:two-component system, OmpR family, response regulator